MGGEPEGGWVQIVGGEWHGLWVKAGGFVGMQDERNRSGGAGRFIPG